MKIKYYIIVTGILVSLGFMSCSGDEPAYGESIADKMRINQNYSGDLNFDKNHEEYVDIGASAGLPWNLYTSESWISFSPTSGVGPQQVKVTVTDNDKTTSRHGYIRVHSMRFDKEDDISVSQAGSYLKITNSTGKDVTASNSYSNYQTTSVVGETQKYSIETNANWEVAYSYPSSLVVEPKSGKSGITNIQVKSTANTGSYTTHPEIQFKTAASDKYYLNLEQAAPYFDIYNSNNTKIGSTTQSFSVSGDSKTYKIKTNSTWSVYDKPSWITSVTPSSGNPGETTITVKASASNGNTNTQSIRFKTIKSTYEYMYVKQEAPYFYIYDSSGYSVVNNSSNPSSLSPSGETKTFKISTNSTWKVAYKSSWITSVTPSSGNPGETNISVKVLSNTNSSVNNGYIRFETQKTTMDYLYVKQEPEKEFSISMSSTNYSANGTYEILYIKDLPSGQSWKATVDQSWVHFGTSTGAQTYNGTGSSSVRVYVDANPTKYKRSANITVTSGTKQKPQQITQDAGIGFIVKSVDVGNVDYYGNIINNYGSIIYSSQTRYLAPRINVTVGTSGYYLFYTKLYNPSGILQRNTAESPSGYTWKNGVNMDIGEHAYYLSGFGSNTSGTWGKGTYKYEIWYNSKKVGEKSFTIY